MAQTAEQKKVKRRAYYVAHRAVILARAKAYLEANRESLKTYKKQWWAANRATNLAKKKANRIARRDAIAERQREWYAANADKVKAKSREYRRTNPEKSRTAVQTWCKANAARLRLVKAKWQRADYQRDPEKYREIQSRRKALKLRATVEKINFKKILRDANGMCGICHKPFDLFGIDFDHIVPLARGGPHTTDNIQATHSHCNRAKGAKAG